MKSYTNMELLWMGRWCFGILGGRRNYSSTKRHYETSLFKSLFYFCSNSILFIFFFFLVLFLNDDMCSNKWWQSVFVFVWLMSSHINTVGTHEKLSLFDAIVRELAIKSKRKSFLFLLLFLLSLLLFSVQNSCLFQRKISYITCKTSDAIILKDIC